MSMNPDTISRKATILEKNQGSLHDSVEQLRADCAHVDLNKKGDDSKQQLIDMAHFLKGVSEQLGAYVLADRCETYAERLQQGMESKEDPTTPVDKSLET